MNMTIVHNSDVCRCAQCSWANESERRMLARTAISRKEQIAQRRRALIAEVDRMQAEINRLDSEFDKLEDDQCATP